MSEHVSEADSTSGATATSQAPRVRLILGAAAIVATAVGFLVIGFLIGQVAFVRTPEPVGVNASVGRNPESAAATATEIYPASSSDGVGAGQVEVPDLAGMRADEAIVLLQTAGFAVVVNPSGAEVSTPASRTVLSQTPQAGAIAPVESTVTLTAPRLSLAAQPAGAVRTTRLVAPRGSVVCIDPTHELHSDSGVEPLGPGSKSMMARATGGATGAATGIPEYETDLELAMNLKRRLEATGVKVVMTRTTNDVALSNAARAAVANHVHADLFLRVSCCGSTVASDAGVATLYPVPNHWTTAYAAKSAAAARVIQAAVCRRTGAENRGASAQDGMVGFNWARAPAVLVMAGFLSNPVEDRLLASPNYQDRVAQGMAEGVVTYLNERGHR